MCLASSSPRFQNEEGAVNASASVHCATLPTTQQMPGDVRHRRQFVDSTDRRLVCSNVLEAWCSGLTCSPVKAEIAGSNPVASAHTSSRLTPPDPSGVFSLSSLSLLSRSTKK